MKKKTSTKRREGEVFRRCLGDHLADWLIADGVAPDYVFMRYVA